MINKLHNAIQLYDLKGIHPAADLLPMMTKDEFERLVEDVKTNGFIHPVRVTDDGLIIDGRNRLCASIETGKDVSIERFNPVDPIGYVLSENVQRRHLTTSQRAMIATEAEKLYAVEAKERQRAGGGWHGNRYEKVAVVTNLSQPPNKEKASQKASKALNVGKSSVFNAKKLKSEAPELAEQVQKGEKTLNAAMKENKENQIVKSNSKFNETNDSIEWAKYTWNPVTGCLYNCSYCYARDIAERFNGHFNPEFHPKRLDAPKNTKCKSNYPNNVFVCSMADLFGEWVASDWIEQVLEAVKDNPQWNFLFLTKNPKRYLEFDFPVNCWLGATADNKKRAEKAIEVFEQIGSHTRFLSCEPLKEDIGLSDFGDLPVDWIIVGGQSRSSREPAMQPDWIWVDNILHSARLLEIPIYFKPNLTVRPKMTPIK